MGLDTKIMIVVGLEEEKCQNTHFPPIQAISVKLGVDEIFSSLASLIYVAQTSCAYQRAWKHVRQLYQVSKTLYHEWFGWARSLFTPK